MMPFARRGVWWSARFVGALLVAWLALGLAACGDAPTPHGAAALAATAPPARSNATAVSIGATPSSSRTPAPSATVSTRATPSSTTARSATQPSANCAVRFRAGSADDSVDADLTCTVSHAATGDTSFALHFSIADPLGRLLTLSGTCDGQLANGTGTCSHTFEFIVAFQAVPGPITGEALPSHTPIGGPSPTVAP